MKSLDLHGAASYFLRRCATLVVCVSCAIPISHSQPFTPDSNFGTNGRVLVPQLSGVSTDRYGVALYPDGRLLLVGTCSPGPGICMARLNANGALDSSFGNGGVVNFATATSGSFDAVTLQRDQKILVTGSCYEQPFLRSNVCVHRFNTNGSIDSSYGVAGVSMIPGFNRDFNVNGAGSLTPDGGLLVSGTCVIGGGDSRFCAMRLTSSGAPDPSFGSNGAVMLDFAPSVYVNRDARHALQSDGKTVIAGECGLEVSLAWVPCLTRLNRNGELDSGFGVSGHTVMPAASVQTATLYTGVQDLLLRPDGRIFLLNNYGNIFGKISLFAFSSNGALDTSFGTSGRQIHEAVANAFSFRAVSQANGAIVVHSNCADANFNSAPCAGRFNADGTIDALFPISNITPPTTAYRMRMLAIQPDGKVVIAGNCDTGNAADPTRVFCAVRLVGGPTDYPQCSSDIDGDGVIAPQDSVLLSRIAAGLRGNAVTQGLSFAAHATRRDWASIRDYLYNQCAMKVVP